MTLVTVEKTSSTMPDPTMPSSFGSKTWVEAVKESPTVPISTNAVPPKPPHPQLTCKPL